MLRHESCEIRLHGNGTFIAENVDLEGNISIDVPSGYVMRACLGESGIEWKIDPIPKDGVLEWNYQFHPVRGVELKNHLR